jgi:DNA-binding NarL/FixJ family response regulator
MNESLVRILVVDDHPIVRDGLTAVLSTQADFAVVGDVDNGADALAKIDALRPDVVLLDLEMPGMDGVAVLQALQRRDDSPPVIVFTAFDADERIVDAVRAGARGYLLKGAPRAELFQAVRIVHAGGSLLQPMIASRLMQRLAHEPEQLTEREMEVLRLLARGSANRDIAGRLVITERTVKFHVSSILGKLNARNRTEAVAIARQRALLHPET